MRYEVSNKRKWAEKKKKEEKDAHQIIRSKASVPSA